MKKILLVVIASTLTGCAAIMGASPTFQYCQEVHYNRAGNQLDISAKCSAPIGGGSLPIPIPGVP